MRKLLIGAAFASATLVAGVTTSARATYPGGVGRIAFASSGTSGNYDVWTATSTGADRKRLTDAKGLDGCPAYSPDGQTIAFCSERTGKYEIWVMTADGSNQRQLTQRKYDAFLPDISPDGRRVAFSTSDGSP